MEDKILKLEKRILREEHKSQVILGVFLLIVSGLNILEALVKMVVRHIYAADTLKAGTMQNNLAFVKLFIVIVAYIICSKKMQSLYFHSPYVRKLLFAWGVILIPVQLMYDLSSLIYNRMLGMIWLILSNYYTTESQVMYAMFYDSSHGFKYLGMFMAMIIGIVMTGVILEKRNLIAVSAILAVIFMVSFAAINMKTMTLDVLSINIGINFTSLLFHGLTTVGLGILGLYVIYSYIDKKIEI